MKHILFPVSMLILAICIGCADSAVGATAKAQPQLAMRK